MVVIAKVSRLSNRPAQ